MDFARILNAIHHYMDSEEFVEFQWRSSGEIPGFVGIYNMDMYYRTNGEEWNLLDLEKPQKYDISQLDKWTLELLYHAYIDGAAYRLNFDVITHRLNIDYIDYECGGEYDFNFFVKKVGSLGTIRGFFYYRRVERFKKTVRILKERIDAEEYNEVMKEVRPNYITIDE